MQRLCEIFPRGFELLHYSRLSVIPKQVQNRDLRVLEAHMPRRDSADPVEKGCGVETGRFVVTSNDERE